MGWSVIGHDQAVNFVEATIKRGRTPHAWLITGPERSGRRLLAMNIAAALNCSTIPEDSPRAYAPCGKCRQCRRVMRDIHADVKTISLRRSASGEETTRRQQISIEDIHTIRSESHLKPFEGRKKTFIIDDADKTSVAASNALLKTLEEPPEDIAFALIATSEGDLLPTVASRCTVVRLRQTSLEVIRKELRSRLEEQRDEDQIELLTRMSRGKIGWAIAAASDQAMVEKGTQALKRAAEVFQSGLESRFNTARVISGSWRLDPREVTEELDWWLWWWRDLALVKAACSEGIIAIDSRETLEQASLSLEMKEIRQGIDAVNGALSDLRANVAPRLALEVMLMNMPTLN